MSGKNEKQWVRVDQLDIPLCDIFGNVQTNGTARTFIRLNEMLFGLPMQDLESMSYEELNLYIEELDTNMELVREGYGADGEEEQSVDH
jgi:hypothetical protein